MNRPSMTRPIGPAQAGVISEVPLGSVKLWKDNPRKNDNAAQRLSEILKMQSQVTPIVVWTKNMTIYKGNTTFKALNILTKTWTRMEPGQSRELFDQIRRKVVKVLYRNFPSDIAAAAYAISDNKASEYGEWDDTMLQEFLKAPEILKGSGFNDVEKRALFFEPEPHKIEKINAANIGLKDKIVLIVLDAAKRDSFKEMLQKWIVSSGFKGVEVK